MSEKHYIVVEKDELETINKKLDAIYGRLIVQEAEQRLQADKELFIEKV